MPHYRRPAKAGPTGRPRVGIGVAATHARGVSARADTKVSRRCARSGSPIDSLRSAFTVDRRYPPARGARSPCRTFTFASEILLHTKRGADVWT